MIFNIDSAMKPSYSNDDTCFSIDVINEILEEDFNALLNEVAPTTVEHRLARKNELKARGTLLMALTDKDQLKFNTHKDAKTLMEALEKRFGWNTETKKRNTTDLEEQSLDDLFNSLKIYEAEVKSFSSASTTTQNIAFVSSSNTDITKEPVSAAASVSAISANLPVSALLNVDSLSNAVIYSIFASQSSSPQLDNDDLKKIDADDLVEMDLKWQMAMLIVECYNCHRKGHFARECRSHKDTRRNGAAEPQRRNVPVETSTSNALVSQCDGVGRYDWSFQAEDEPTNYALMAFSSSSSSSDNELRDNALVSLRQNLDKAEQERDDLKLMLEKFQTSSKNLRSDESFPPSPIYDRYQSGNGYHAVPLPYTGIFMPPKPDLVFNNAPNDIETDHPPFNVKLSPTKPDQDLSHTHRPLAPIIEDWVSNSEDESETQTPHNVLSFVPPVKQVKSPRPSIQHVKTSIPAATPKPKTAQPTSRNHAKRENHKQYAQMKLPNPQRHVVPAAVLTPSKLVPINTARPITAVVPKIKVTRPRQDKSVVTKPNSPPRRHINHSPSPKSSTFPPKVNAVKAPKVNAAQVVQGKWEWKLKCPILDHVSRNTSASMTLKRFDYND
nr:hypothetical protein [Tanacetum cinerariifolium]